MKMGKYFNILYASTTSHLKYDSGTDWERETLAEKRLKRAHWREERSGEEAVQTAQRGRSIGFVYFQHFKTFAFAEQ